MSARLLDAFTLQKWSHTAVGDLVTHADEINRLNVFPVADADTGTNMLFTMRSAWAQAEALAGADDVAEVASALARGAIHGARGNSGVILSQILRALAEVTAEASADLHGGLDRVDGPLFAAALHHAVVLVIRAMGEAVPGTIVTVLQGAAEAAEQASTDGAELPEVVCRAADAAAQSLEQTTGQLDVLARAGVVDAGGRGLLVLLDAMSATLTGSAPRRTEYIPAPPPHTDNGATRAVAAPQFEVMYLLSGCDAAGVEKLRNDLDGLGDSVAIAAPSDGSGHYSVHVHADDAGAAVEAGLAVGATSRIQITALSGTRDARPVRAWSHGRTVLAVVDGTGAEELFAAEGAHVLRLEGDAPVSAKQLLHALVNADAGQAMILPNGYVAAEELVAGCTAAMGWGLDVVPVPTASMVQGLAALAVHDDARQAVDDGYTMARAAAGARHGSVRIATEEAHTWAGMCKPGDGLGISGDEVLIVGDDLAAAGAGLIDLLLAAGGELVTVLTGAGVDEDVAGALSEHVHDRHPGVELVTYHTGHRGDALLIGVE
ncbi:dihydroxyacetone kinase [Mycobacterium sp. 852002-51152_SCH6134967]|uniref:DAK2 domain-containing protein n=1 Tax=Mycobacterium sp. 852002-51152_SCH6134967 TaxID=1834096 RepID=UPI0007FEF9A3|nr:DAK2 domain-containing protein [Mycobacterium sp. 852002-51152_SCH6134967]OBF92279.1 dihydroxyacetone kinase [Mycobacterium sp. 852002-51152_SCH6134967]